MIPSPERRAALASAAAYAAVILVMGRQVIGSLASGIASDVGDPVLNAAILAWNATQLPWTEAWYDFPGFYPATDGLTFTEHLLGVSIVATPIYWVTRDAAVTYNVTTLLMYLLCGVAMYALVWRLTRHAGASFVAGLAFMLAPYRAAQLPHLQVISVPWAPLALAGLHAYLETGRRRWLALFGAGWVLQGAANGYFLVFFSVLAGLWVLWFVAGQRRWRDLGMIAVAGILAVLPLAPILVRFVEAHDRYMLSRTPEEILSLSADVSSVLCADSKLSLWGWLDIGCAGERQLFPGAALLVVCAAAAWASRGSAPARAGGVVVASRISAALFAAGILMFASAVSVAVAGPWEWTAGPLAISSSSVLKPFTRGALLLLLAAVVSPAVRTAAARASAPAFYALAAAATWVLSWGPSPTLNGQPALEPGPYAALMLLPGVDGLRVPARFWMMTILCLCVLAGVLLARATRVRGRTAAAAIVVVAAAGLLGDGWAAMPSARLLPPPPRPDVLRGETVLTLPLGGNVDIDAAAQYEAVAGGWVSVNGYSGYGPPHYGPLRAASEEADPLVFAPFRARGDLHVVVHDRSDRHVALVEAQPGARLVAAGSGMRQYQLPRQGALPPGEPGGERLAIAGVEATCSREMEPLARDDDYGTRWQCGPQTPGQQMTADLGRVVTVGAVVPALGAFPTDFARGLAVETSVDGAGWQPAWDGGTLLESFEAQVRDPRSIRIVLRFTPRPARFVRLRLLSRNETWYWSIAELEVWSDGVPP
jgi:hypothetical protein